MDDSSSKLVEKIEELVDLTRETNQLLGEMMGVIETLRNAQGTNQEKLPSGPRESYGPPVTADSVDSAILNRETRDGAMAVSVFHPKVQAPPGWLRISVKYPDARELAERVAMGCLCGKSIVTRTAPGGDEYWSCEGVIQPGGCRYRPAVQGRDLKFVMSIPPSK